MPGVVALRKIQIGLEGTAGTAVPATNIWRGEGTGEDTSEYVFPAEQVGVIGGTDRQYKDRDGGKVTMTQDATFEQILYALECGIASVSASADGAGSGQIREYPFPTTSDSTVKTATVEFGDNIWEEEMEYSYVPSWSLGGSAGGVNALSIDWEGRRQTPTSFTGSLSIPSVSEIITSKSKLYIDSVSDTIGTTQKTGTLLSYALSVNTGLMPYFTQDGNTYFTGIKRGAGEIKLDLTFESDAISVAQKALWRAGTPQQIRLIFEGDALTTPGTLYTYKTLILDFAGKFEKFGPLGDQDGNNTITGTFVARYNATAGLRFKVTNVTDLVALP